MQHLSGIDWQRFAVLERELSIIKLKLENTENDNNNELSVVRDYLDREVEQLRKIKQMNSKN